MTPDMLVFVISAFCAIKDPNVSRIKKMDCIEFLSNCSVGPGGQISNKKVDECKEQWISRSEIKF